MSRIFSNVPQYINPNSIQIYDESESFNESLVSPSVLQAAANIAHTFE